MERRPNYRGMVLERRTSKSCHNYWELTQWNKKNRSVETITERSSIAMCHRGWKVVSGTLAGLY
eukprot:94688-Amphidinium_carterae.1